MKFVSSNVVLAQAIMAIILNTKVSSASVRGIRDENKDDHYSRGRELQGATVAPTATVAKAFKKNVAPTATVAKAFKKNGAPTATVAKAFKKNGAPTATVGKTPKKNGSPTMPKTGKKLFGGKGKASKVQVTSAPTKVPTGIPSLAPSISNDPISMPSGSPSSAPSVSAKPSMNPSVSAKPSMNPSVSAKPSMTPSAAPSVSTNSSGNLVTDGFISIVEQPEFTTFIQTGSNDKKSPAGITDDFIDSGSNDRR